MKMTGQDGNRAYLIHIKYFLNYLSLIYIKIIRKKLVGRAVQDMITDLNLNLGAIISK